MDVFYTFLRNSGNHTLDAGFLIESRFYIFHTAGADQNRRAERLLYPLAILLKRSFWK
jgi:hypothetical protein